MRARSLTKRVAAARSSASRLLWAGWVVCLAMPLTTEALTPSREELAEARAWTAMRFEGKAVPPSDGPGRRHESFYESARLQLRALEEEARYVIRTSGRTNEFSGRELMVDGLPVALPEKPSAAVVGYRRVQR
jgi:hypothetical protein